MKPKNLSTVIGMVICLTKQIYLREPEDGSGQVEKFTTAKRGANPFLGSSGMEWWVTHDTFKSREELSEKAVFFDSQLEGGDIASFSKIITKTLWECAGVIELFTIEINISSGAGTLFEARAIKNPREFGEQLWNRIRTNLANSLVQWMTMYPLRLIKADSFPLNFSGLTLLNSSDQQQWIKLSESYPESRYWNPTTGAWNQRINNQTMQDFVSVPSWLVCETSGTASGSRSLAGDNMRTFIAVLCSYLDKNTPSFLTKSGATPARYSIQFADDTSKAECSSIMAPIGNLFPPLLLNSSTLEVSSNVLSEIESWYRQRASASEPAKRRATTAAHFVHYGIIYDDLERFIHFFIALDALFGEKGNTGINFQKGIRRTFPKQKIWEDRADKLYALRNALVHGGISSISRWDKLDSYRRYHKSHPLKDIQTAAMTALRVYFSNQVFDHLFS